MLDKNDPRLTAYVLGELSTDERAEIERDLAESSELRGEIESLRAAIGQVERYFADDLQTAARGSDSSVSAAASDASLETGALEKVALADRPGADQPRMASNGRRRLVGFVVVSLSLLVLAGVALPWALEDNESAIDIAFFGGRSTAIAPEKLDTDDESGYQGLPHDDLAPGDAIAKDARAEGESGAASASHPSSSDPYGDTTGEYASRPMSPGVGGFSYSLNPGEGELARATPRIVIEAEESTPRFAEVTEPLITQEMLPDLRRMTQAAGGRLPDVTGPSDDSNDGVDLPISDPGGGLRLEGRGDLATGSDTPRRPSSGEGREFYDVRSEVHPEPQLTPRPTSAPSPGTYSEASRRPSVNRQQGGESSVEELRAVVGAERDAQRALETSSDEKGNGNPSEPRSNDLDAEGKSNDQTREGGQRQSGQKGERGREMDKREDARSTWRRAAATPNSARLMIGDDDGLPLEGMQTNVVVDGFRARILTDYYFFNDRGRPLEGTFQLRLPNEASLYYFAFGPTSFEYRPQVDQLVSRGFLPADVVRGSGTGPRDIAALRQDTWTNVKEARLVPPQKAAFAYGEVVRRRIDPALVEWAGAGIFNSRVFPLNAGKLHRIVVGYDVNLQPAGDGLAFHLDLPEGVPQRSVDLDVAAEPGAILEVVPEVRPFVSGGRAFYHFQNPEGPVTARFPAANDSLIHGRDDGGREFFAARITPKLDDDQDAASRVGKDGGTDGKVGSEGDVGEGASSDGVAGSPRAIFLLDTSLSANPDKFNVWLKLLEATLAENRGDLKQFAVLMFNVETHWWRDGWTDNTPDAAAELLDDCRAIALEGATDLNAAVREVARWTESLDVDAEGEDERRLADLFLLSDGAATWGETSASMIVHTLSELHDQGRVGPLFAFQTGLQGTDSSLLDQLAQSTGGAVFSVTSEDEVVRAATAHRRRPWRLVGVAIDGGNDLLIAGRPRSIYTGQSLLVVGRGAGGSQAVIELRRGEETRSIVVPLVRAVESTLAARLYGQVAVGQLELAADAAEPIAVAYARHFRVTGRSVSLLMLESEADYQQFGIRDEDDAVVVDSTSAHDVVEQKLDEVHAMLSDPKQQTLAWLARLESAPGLEFTIPPALKIALESLPPESFRVDAPRLDCNKRRRDELPAEFNRMIASGELSYDALAAEAERRRREAGDADGLKTLSSLVELRPGDTVAAADLAFTAMSWQLPAHAYPLLRRAILARPFEPHLYLAMAQCLDEAGREDLAAVYYEVLLNAQWNERQSTVRQIASVDYFRMLRTMKGAASTPAQESADDSTQASGKDSAAIGAKLAPYVAARLRSLEQNAVAKADLAVVIMWNTDRTDVDLHVTEPSGEVCSYQHTRTASGGQITQDITTGFGPEMYTLENSPTGEYQFKAHYFSSDANRTAVRTRVLIAVYERLNQPDERVTRRVVTLNHANDMNDLGSIAVKP